MGKFPSLFLFGYPRYLNAEGEDVRITSKKAIALISLLATAPEGTRSRAYLQQKLWGSRGTRQAQSSLRRELANLRKAVPSLPLLTDFRTVGLDLSRIEVDALDPDRLGSPNGEFLEGVDIAGEDDFEDWLREMRARFNQYATAPEAGSPQPPAARNTRFAEQVQPRLALLIPAPETLTGPTVSRIHSLQRELAQRLTNSGWFTLEVLSGLEHVEASVAYLLASDAFTSDDCAELAISVYRTNGTGKSGGGEVLGARTGRLDADSSLRDVQLAGERLAQDIIGIVVHDIFDAVREHPAQSTARKLWKARALIDAPHPDGWDKARQLLHSLTESSAELDAYIEMYRLAIVDRHILGRNDAPLQELAGHIDRLQYTHGLRPYALLYRAMCALLDGEQEEAASYHARVRQNCPLDARVALVGSLIELSHAQTGDNTANLRDIFAEQQTNPYNFPFMSYLALIEYHLDDLVTAIAHARNSLSVGGGVGLGWMVLVASLRRQGKGREADRLQQSFATRNQVCIDWTSQLVGKVNAQLSAQLTGDFYGGQEKASAYA